MASSGSLPVASITRSTPSPPVSSCTLACTSAGSQASLAPRESGQVARFRAPGGGEEEGRGEGAQELHQEQAHEPGPQEHDRVVRGPGPARRTVLTAQDRGSARASSAGSPGGRGRASAASMAVRSA